MYLTVEQIASVCHELNRAYCRVLGDNTQPAWDEAPEWQRGSAIIGVNDILTGSISTPRESHESWATQKLNDGWKWGPTKNPELKEHPNLVDYDELPYEQRVKDTLFYETVRILSGR